MEIIDRNALYNKVLWRVMPLPFLYFFFNGLDRNNIGFAGLTMNAELGITS